MRRRAAGERTRLAGTGGASLFLFILPTSEKFAVCVRSFPAHTLPLMVFPLKTGIWSEKLARSVFPPIFFIFFLIFTISAGGAMQLQLPEPSVLKYFDTTIKLLATHSGRDKVAKTFHYASRILVWHFQNRGKKERADQVEQFRQAIGNSRRVGRFFSFVNSVPSLYQLACPDPRTKDRESDLFRFLLLVANVSDMLYYVSDNLTYAAKYNFVKLSPKANYFWYLPRSRQKKKESTFSHSFSFFLF